MRSQLYLDKLPLSDICVFILFSRAVKGRTTVNSEPTFVLKLCTKLHLALSISCVPLALIGLQVTDFCRSKGHWILSANGQV